MDENQSLYDRNMGLNDINIKGVISEATYTKKLHNKTMNVKNVLIQTIYNLNQRCL